MLSFTHGRNLYRYDADESPATYVTNYLITAVCWLGIAAFLLLKPKPQQPSPPSAAAFARAPPTMLLLIHLGLYGIVMLIGGLGHQVWKHNKCPGIEMPANVSVPCPDGGTDNEPAIQSYLFFLGPCEFLLFPISIALSGLAGKCHGAYLPILVVALVLGLAAGCYGAAMGHDGFFILGALLALNYLTLTVLSLVGICVDGTLKLGRAIVSSSSLLLLVGFGIQVLYSPSCGSEAYFSAEGIVDCPFNGDGVTGINHNFVYHVFEIISKLMLVVGMRFLVVDPADKPGNLELGQQMA